MGETIREFYRQWAISERDVKAFKRLPPGSPGNPRKLK